MDDLKACLRFLREISPVPVFIQNNTPVIRKIYSKSNWITHSQIKLENKFPNL